MHYRLHDSHGPLLDDLVVFRAWRDFNLREIFPAYIISKAFGEPSAGWSWGWSGEKQCCLGMIGVFLDFRPQVFVHRGG